MSTHFLCALQEEVAYLPSWATNYYKFDSQISDKMYLEGGTPYYMEARMKEWSGGDFLQVGVFMYDTPIIASQYDGAVSEEQTIAVTSNVQNEHQVHSSNISSPRWAYFHVGEYAFFNVAQLYTKC